MIRHSGCTWCRVKVSVTSTALTLTVEDDGAGPAAPGRAAHAGDGLRNLDERARAFGGRSRLQRRAPHGARLVWRAPLP